MSQLPGRCIEYKVKNCRQLKHMHICLKYKVKYFYIEFYSFEFVYIKESDVKKYGLTAAQMNTIVNNVHYKMQITIFFC